MLGNNILQKAYYIYRCYFENRYINIILKKTFHTLQSPY